MQLHGPLTPLGSQWFPWRRKTSFEKLRKIHRIRFPKRAPRAPKIVFCRIFGPIFSESPSEAFLKRFFIIIWKLEPWFLLPLPMFCKVFRFARPSRSRVDFSSILLPKRRRKASQIIGNRIRTRMFGGIDFKIDFCSLFHGFGIHFGNQKTSKNLEKSKKQWFMLNYVVPLRSFSFWVRFFVRF